MWIRNVQEETVKQLTNEKRIKNDAKQLNLQLDQNGLIRCYGRPLTNDEGQKNNSIYLPKKNYLT